MNDLELAIIGAGSAGLAAGLYGVRSGLKTLVLEEKIAGGATVDAPLVENYLGFQGISGTELTQKMVAHAKSAGVAIKEFERVTNLSLDGERKIVKTQKSEYGTKTVIIASGSSYRRLGIPGEREFSGKGVSYCGICDGPLFRGKRLLVVGGGNTALITALYLADLAFEVKIAHRRSVFRGEEALVQGLKAKSNVEVLWNTEIREIRGEKSVSKVVSLDTNTGEVRELAVDGVFVQIGEAPNSQVAKEGGVAVDEDGYIIVDAVQRTNVEGVYAAGDVTNHPVKQIATAVGQGVAAAIEAYGFIRRPYYKR